MQVACANNTVFPHSLRSRMRQVWFLLRPTSLEYRQEPFLYVLAWSFLSISSFLLLRSSQARWGLTLRASFEPVLSTLLSSSTVTIPGRGRAKAFWLQLTDLRSEAPLPCFHSFGRSYYEMTTHGRGLTTGKHRADSRLLLITIYVLSAQMA